MNDLISRQEAIDAIENFIEHPAIEHSRMFREGMDNAFFIVRNLLRTMPSAQHHGEWVWVQYDANPELGNFHCSECHFMPACFNWSRKHLNFCPNCGADMRGEKMNEICTDNRFELIAKYKTRLVEATNIETSQEEMKVIDNILFRFWQMGWLDKLELPSAQQWIPCSERLPKPLRDVLVCIDGGDESYPDEERYFIELAFYDGFHKHWIDPDLIDPDENIKAWMPLPEPYKGEQE